MYDDALYGIDDDVDVDVVMIGLMCVLHGVNVDAVCMMRCC